MKRTVLLVTLFVFAVTSQALAKVTINNTARCFFGNLVLAEKEIEKTAGVDIVMNNDCAGIDEGVKAVLAGKADIGTCARTLTAKEKKAGLVLFPLSKDAVAVIVNKKNPVDELSYKDVLGIFAGNIKNWKAVGGDNKKILLMTQACGASEENILPKWWAAKGIRSDSDYLKKATIESDITDNLIGKIESYTMGIALVSQMFYTDKTKFIKVDGYLPTRKNVLGNSYPLVRPMNLVVKGEPKGEVKKVVDYLTSPAFKKWTEKGLAMDWLKEGF